MSDLDRDLREALAPLAGQPERDVSRVLTLLDEQAGPALDGSRENRNPAGDGSDGSEPERRLPAPLRWMAPVALGAAAGLLVGLLLAPPRTEPASPPPDTPIDGPGPGTQVAFVGEVLVQRGKAWVEREPLPGGAIDPEAELSLGAGLPEAAMLVVPRPERRLDPRYEPVLIAKLREGRSLRVRAGSRVMVASPASVNLLAGEIAVVPAPEDRRPVTIETMEGTVEARGAGVQVLARDGEVLVLGLTGSARFIDMSGTAHTVPAGRVITVRPGEVSAPEPARPLWDSLAWQAHALMLSQFTQDEAIGYAVQLVEEFAGELEPDEIRRRISMAGDLGETALIEVLVRRDDFSEDIVEPAAELLPNVATYHAVPVLIGLVGAQSPKMRVAAFRAIRRLTNVDVGTDEAFWRDASPADRFDALQRLRRALGSY